MFFFSFKYLLSIYLQENEIDFLKNSKRQLLSERSSRFNFCHFSLLLLVIFVYCCYLSLKFWRHFTLTS